MTEITFAALLRETIHLMRGNAWRIAIAMVLLVAIPVFADLGVDPRDRSGIDIVAAFVSVFLQTWLTVAVLEANDRRQGGRGVGTVFGIGILNGLGVLIGLVLLIVPGIFLLVRWSISVPYALAEDVGVIDALQASFEQTRDAFWPILAVLIACYAPSALAFASIYLFETDGITLISSLVVNVSINVALFAGWHAAGAIYLAARRGIGLSETFA